MRDFFWILSLFCLSIALLACGGSDEDGGLWVGAGSANESTPKLDGCVVGETRCAGLYSQESCYQASEGLSIWSPEQPCPSGTFCKVGSCQPIIVECTEEGSLRCGEAGVVEKCVRTPLGEWQMIPSETVCAEEYGLRCIPPPYPAKEPWELCRNACMGHTMLSHQPGSPETSPSCGGVYECDGPEQTRQQHEECWPPYTPCERDAQCASLRCQLFDDTLRCVP